jgi:outer membrane protein assembly factor BamB
MSPGRISSHIITSLAVVGSIVSLIWWFSGDHFPAEIEIRKAGMDNRPKTEPRSDTVIIGEFFSNMDILEEIIPGKWPRFRGSYFDNINHDTIPLSDSWGTDGPPVAWKISLGEGYSGPAVYNGRVYILDYNERIKADMLRCFSLKTGEELWRRWYFVDIKRNHGYSRTVPAVTEKYLVSIGPRSHVMCVDPLTGDLFWTLDMEKEFAIPGTTKGKITPDWYTGQCPLIDDGVAVLAPGGKALMIGIDCATGKELWRTPNPDSLRMSHGSIMPMTIHGKRMYVYNAIGGVCGVSAEGSDRGRMLWITKEWNPATTAASPLYLGNNEIAVFGSYGAGGARLRIEYNGASFSAILTESHKAMEGASSDQHTPIITGNLLWTVMPENAGELKKQLVCYNISDLRTPVWTSGRENRYGRGLGPYIVSNDRMFLLDDDANLYVYKLESSGASLLSQYQILDGIEAWGPMAIAGNYLIMRDSKNLVSLYIGKKEL